MKQSIIITFILILLAGCGKQTKLDIPAVYPIETNESLQTIVTTEMQSQIEQWHPVWAYAVMMDQTSTIVSLFSYDSTSDESQIWRSDPLGTIMTPFAILAASRSGAINEQTVLPYSEEGFVYDSIKYFDFFRLKDTAINVQNIIAMSSKEGTCKLMDLAFRDTLPLFKDYMSDMGIHDTCLSLVDLYSQALGAKPILPLHVVWLYSTLFQGNFPEDVWGSTDYIIKGLHDAVWNNHIGTASVSSWGRRRAQSNIVSIMGKTGSFHNRNEDGGDSYTLSFVGGFPECDPKYTCLVIVDIESEKMHDLYANSGDICATAVRRIAERIYFEEQDESELQHKSFQDCVNANLQTIIQSIIDGDCEKLASVTSFPIYRPYPEKDIHNQHQLKEYFNILFDDSIKSVLKNTTIDDWERFGWRGYSIMDGEFLWATESGLLNGINYESDALKTYRDKLKKEEEYLNQVATYQCLLSEDSTLFLRIQKRVDDWQLQMYTRGGKKTVFSNGTMEVQGTCGNEFFQFPCIGGDTIEMILSSPSCLGEAEYDYLIITPDNNSFPQRYRNQYISLTRAYWRDVRKWWN